MNHAMKITWRLLAVMAAVLIGKLVIGGAVYGMFETPPWENAPTLAELLPSMVAGVILTVLAVAYPAIRSGLRGGRLFLALFLAMFGIGVFLVNIEGAIFLILTPQQLLAGVVDATLQAAWLAFLVTVLLVRGIPLPNGSPGPAASLTTGTWIRRFAGASLAYVFLYFVAGLMIIGQVEDFYATQNMQVGAWFLPLQVCRGALYVASALYLLRNMHCARWQASLAMGFMFPILAGVAGLLSPNPIMPEAIRYWHILEIGWSNVVYGMLVGYLFWKPRQLRAGNREPVTAEPAQA